MADWIDQISDAVGKNDDPTTVSHWLNTGHPLLNDAISGSYHGGLPVGRIVEMFGESSTGKTAIATAAMIEAQRLGGVAAFMDHENSFDHELAVGNGLNINERWVFKKPDSFEQSIDTVVKACAAIRERKLISPDAPIIFVFDSLASMVPKSKLDKDSAEFNMNDNTALARATSAAFPALAKHCERHQFLALFLNQVRTKPGVMFGDNTTTPGGSAPEYYSSVRISLTRAQITKVVKGDKQIIGQKVTANMKKNKVHRPFEKAKWDFRFQDDGTGMFDPVGSVLDVLIDQGAVKKGGQFIEWDGKKLHRDDVIERINASGDREQLYKLLPGWADDKQASGSAIDWNNY